MFMRTNHVYRNNYVFFLAKLNNRKQIDVCVQKYRLCTKRYLADGKDGYDVFRSCQQLV